MRLPKPKATKTDRSDGLLKAIKIAKAHIRGLEL